MYKIRGTYIKMLRIYLCSCSLSMSLGMLDRMVVLLVWKDGSPRHVLSTLSNDK
jgi:hypothetical protein